MKLLVAVIWMTGAALSLGIVTPSFSQTSVPVGMSYQGRITDIDGNPVADGNDYEIEVRLWTTATGGVTPMWGSRYAGVSVRAGAFNLILGAPGGTPIGGAISDLKTVFTTAPAIYLGITVTKGNTGSSISGPTEILPRQQLLSNPYAFRAEQAASVDIDTVLSVSIKEGENKSQNIADTAVTLDKLGPGAVDSSKVLDLSLNSDDVAIGGLAMNRIATEYAIFIDEKSANTNGGNAMPGWQTRTLTKTESLAGNSIFRAGNVITLQPGTYFVDASVPSYAARTHQAILRRIGDDTTAIRGSSESSDTIGDNAASRSLIQGYVTVSTSTSFDIHHFTRSGNSTTGLGAGTQYSIGQRTEPSVFTTVHILRVK